MNIKQIFEIVGGKLIGNGKAIINWLLTDSRALSFPEETLFFAIKTTRNDGHKYIEELYRKGVRNFVISAHPPPKSEISFSLEGANLIIVENPLTALQQLAVYHRNQFDIPVIGITGSNGKTVVKEWLYQLLNSNYKITRSPRSYNSQIGVPLSVWQMNKNTEIGIFEAGISFPDEMDKLEPIIKPTIGIFTNIGETHQENFTSLKEKCLEKLKLFAHSEVLIYCTDNKLIDICVAQSGYENKKITWGKTKNSDIQVIEIKKDIRDTEISCLYRKNQFRYKISFTDDASIENSLNCLALMLYLKIDIQTIQARMIELQPVAMRLEVKPGINNCIIINDSYNSDLGSLSIVLDFLQQQASDKNSRKTLILSDILQSGQSSSELYKTVATLVKNKGIQQFIGIGKEISAHKKLFQSVENHFFETTEEFLQQLSTFNFQLSTILLKGSRHFQFERISESLELVAHQTILEVNLSALIHNFNYFRSYLKSETKTICMVKAHAYGSGAVEISRTLQHNKCDYLAVAFADEGAELRREGIHIPIMVMNPEPHSFGVIFAENLEPEIYSFGLLKSFMKEAEKQGIIDYPVHIKIDTGMHRLGFDANDIDKLINLLKKQNSVKIRSVFSHLAGADDAKFDDFTKIQIIEFERIHRKISDAFEHHILKHILNSAGIERFPEYQFDMVRLGIGHYGISAVNQQKVQNVCTLKTTILQIKNVLAGETVGYSRKGNIQKDSRIAVLPIGYADGYNRRLSNGVGKVLINGKFAPIIGNICMDLTMVDVTNIDAKEGDIVEIFGNNLSILDVSNWLSTIPYEILTNISRRVKRVYFQE